MDSQLTKHNLMSHISNLSDSDSVSVTASVRSDNTRAQVAEKK